MVSGSIMMYTAVLDVYRYSSATRASLG